MEDAGKLLEQARAQKKTLKKKIAKLKHEPSKKVDARFHDLHEQFFDEFDCLSCANCCKTTSPIFRDIDIKRLANVLSMKEQNFIDRYLYLDSESDYVLQRSPCAFLNSDNTCQVYEHRPKACREYPHTDRKNMHQILDLTLKNTQVCPGVYHVVNSI